MRWTSPCWSRSSPPAAPRRPTRIAARRRSSSSSPARAWRWRAGRRGRSARGTLLVPPGVEHVIRNTGAGKLYCLTLMAPDEEFAALIRGGAPVALTEEDRAVIAGRR